MSISNWGYTMRVLVLFCVYFRPPDILVGVLKFYLDSVLSSSMAYLS